MGWFSGGSTSSSASAGLGAALVAKATSAALLAPDWGLNTDVVDAVNQGWGDHGKDVVKAVRAQVAQPQPRVALLALELLAALMHNCGTQLHECVARKGVLQELTRQAGRSADAEVRNKCLELVHAWGQAFAGRRGVLAAYEECYSSMLQRGFQFPQVGAQPALDPAAAPAQGSVTLSAVAGGGQGIDAADLAAIQAAQAELNAQYAHPEPRVSPAAAQQPAAVPVPVLYSNGVQYYGAGAAAGQLPSMLPRHAHAAAQQQRPQDEVLQQQLAYINHAAANAIHLAPPGVTPQTHAQIAPQPAPAPQMVDTSTPEAVAKLKEEMSVARNSVSVLTEMMRSIDPLHPEGVLDDIVVELADQCEQMQPRVLALVEGMDNEAVMAEALTLNDALQEALKRHKELVDALQRHGQAPESAPARRAPAHAAAAAPVHTAAPAPAPAQAAIGGDDEFLRSSRERMDAVRAAMAAKAAESSRRAEQALSMAARAREQSQQQPAAARPVGGIGSNGTSTPAAAIAAVKLSPPPQAAPRAAAAPAPVEMATMGRASGGGASSSEPDLLDLLAGPTAQPPPARTQAAAAAIKPLSKPPAPSPAVDPNPFLTSPPPTDAAPPVPVIKQAAIPVAKPAIVPLAPPPETRCASASAGASAMDPFADLDAAFADMSTSAGAAPAAAATTATLQPAPVAAPAPRRPSAAADDFLGL